MSLQTKLNIIEAFIPLIDYTNYTVSNYAVSNYGNVKNIKTNRILKPNINNGGYLYINLGRNNTKYIHQLVASVFLNNAENKKCIDHIDGNKKNNEVFNLRYATHTENHFNSVLRKNNTSGIKGVNFHKKANKWQARICISQTFIYIGLFDNIEDAIKARQEKAKELFGEFLNNCEK